MDYFYTCVGDDAVLSDDIFDDGDAVVLPDDPHEEVEVGAQVGGKRSKGKKGREASKVLMLS